MRVATLTEITSANGKQIERQFWTGDKRNKTNLLWPHQPRPNEQAFTTWRKYLSKTFLLDPTTKATKTRRNFELNIPLRHGSTMQEKSSNNLRIIILPQQNQYTYTMKPITSIKNTTVNTKGKETKTNCFSIYIH